MHLALYYVTNGGIRKNISKVFYINMQPYVLLSDKSDCKMSLQMKQLNCLISDVIFLNLDIIRFGGNHEEN